MLELTSEQQTALNRLRDDGVAVDTVLRTWGQEGCIMVEVTGDWGQTMWLGIETDGYTHS